MSEVLVMARRSVRLSLRAGDALITALALPIMMMLLFVYFFGGAIETGGPYVQHVVPGVLVLCAAYGAGTTAMSVANDMAEAVMDRLRSLDVSATALLGGHVAASVARNLAATVLVFAVAFAIGFRPVAAPGDWLLAAALITAFVTAMSWVAAAIGLLAKTPEAASGYAFVFAFLPYPSSAFVPVETMPGWLQAFAAGQPLTQVIDSMRALLLDGSATVLGAAFVWCAALGLAGVAAAAALYRLRVKRA
ncbi:ABC transporter permease [Nonomuraea sp. NPDC050663]|uniref:ABC transporter permease n=1 Tax=Nonomuraea sp. NPDC050663 TaxID=3364370 RepID=UPI0037BDFB35